MGDLYCYITIRISFVEEFVANSAICNRMNEMDVEERRKELVPKSTPKFHFDYHTFSENEIAARTISPFTISDSEKSPVSKFTSSDEEEGMLSDVTDEMLVFEEATVISDAEEGVNDPDEEEDVTKANGEVNLQLLNIHYTNVTQLAVKKPTNFMRFLLLQLFEFRT